MVNVFVCQKFGRAVNDRIVSSLLADPLLEVALSRNK